MEMLTWRGAALCVNSLQAVFLGKKTRGGLHLEQCPAKEEAALCPLPQGLGVFGAGWDWGAELRLEFGAD